MTGIDWPVLEAALARADRLVSPWCATHTGAGHAHCAHPANRHRFDGCACWCHSHRARQLQEAETHD